MEALINTGIALIATETVKELIKNSISTYIKPKLEKSYKNNELDRDLIKVEEYIQDYLKTSYENAEIMNTIVFKNEQIKIDDLYIPLTLVKSDSMYKKRSEKIYIDKYKEDLINKYKKVLIVDSAGMGKSTLMKYLYLCTIKENKGIPILIELRKLEKNVSIIDFILKEINGFKKYIKEEHILSLMEEGDFIFFFDGYDEITKEFKTDVTNNLQEFISKNSKNLFVMSSRDENELNCFGDFQRFDINSLTEEEAYKLIAKYDNYGEISNRLIKDLKTDDNLKIIKEFLENPLMTSLLYKAFDYKGIIPHKKQTFYRQVYDALFEQHDLSKTGAHKRPKESNLDIEDFHIILRTLGFITLNKGVVYSKEEFIKIVRLAKQKNIGIDFNESKFIEDLINAVPIFRIEGDKYRWVHKSFQEYFAASYIYNDCKANYDKILKKLVLNENILKYYNVLDFYYDIDYKGFKRCILYPIIKDYINYYENIYLNKAYDNYSKKYIDLRKSIQYNCKNIALIKIDESEAKQNFRKNGRYFAENFKLKFEPNVSSHIDSKIIVLYECDNINQIRLLLRNKKSKLIKGWFFSQMGEVNELQIINDIKFINSLYEKIDYKVYYINDDIENIVNNNDIFELSTYLVAVNVMSEKQGVTLLFDYDECLNLKNKLEEELKSEKDDLDFI